MSKHIKDEYGLCFECDKPMAAQRSPEWFAARKGRVTGSMVGAILGVNPFMTPADAMRTMVREYLGAEREFQGNVATEWGTAMEAGATIDFTLETGFDVQECGFFKLFDWLGASPDGLVDSNSLIEIKCPYGIRLQDPPVFKTILEVPHYYAQMQIEMFCANRGMAYFYQWTPFGTDLQIVRRNDIWLNDNIPVLYEFWHNFNRECENPESYLEPKRQDIKNQKALRLVAEFIELRDAEEMAKEKKKEILAELVKMAGEKNSEIDGHKLTRVDRKGSVDYKKVPELSGVDLELYRKAGSSSWRLS